MRAAIVADAGASLVVTNLPDPAPGPGELVLRVRAVGICGTDLHLGGDPPIVPAGTVLGHEFAGEVVAVGPGVTGWNSGARVTALPLIGCAECGACEEGDAMGCPAVRLLGAGDLPGAFAEYVRVGARETHRLPDAMSDDAGALVEPFAFARHAVRVAELRSNDGVLVLGAGPIGLAVMAWAGDAGARRVVVADRVARRRALALAMGADAVVDSDAVDVATQVADLLGGPPRVVFECVGRPGLLDRCVGHAERRGCIVVAGACMEPDAMLPALACLKEVQLRFVVSYAHRDFTDALGALAEERIAIGSMITEHVSLGQLPDAFVALQTPATQGKVIVRP